MRKIKLTPAQLSVLRELAKPGAKAQYTNKVTGNYWWLKTNYAKCTKQIEALLSLKMLEKSIETARTRGLNKNSLVATITDAGRAYLAELDSKT